MFRRYNARRILVNTGVLVYTLLVIYALTNGKDRCRQSMPDKDGGMIFPGMKTPSKKRCIVDINRLGTVKVDIFEHPNLTAITKDNSMVKYGGSWKPTDCDPWQKVALIIPYRDRWHHLLLLLKRLHPMLRKQKVNYHLFVVEQEGDGMFNRGRLMNIGVAEALKLAKFDCFIFHDVDLLPESDKNIYYCDQHLRQLSSAIDEMRYQVMYYNYAGGVISINRDNVYRLNGYSNGYWGWGSEDDDISARSIEAGLLLTRPPEYIGRYKMIRHVKQWRGQTAYDLFLTWRSRWANDGLNSLDSSKYKLKSLKAHDLYTNILVDIGQPPKKQPNLDGLPRETYSWFLSFFFP